MIEDSRQLAREPEIAPGIRLVCRAQQLLEFLRNPMSVRAQTARHERKNPVMLCQPDKFAPVKPRLRCAGTVRNALRTKLHARTGAQECEFFRGSFP